MRVSTPERRMQSPTNYYSTNSIPADVIIIFSEYLNILDFLSLQCVCRTWYYFTNKDHLWKSRALKKWVPPRNPHPSWKAYYRKKWEIFIKFEGICSFGLKLLKHHFFESEYWEPLSPGIGNVQTWRRQQNLDVCCVKIQKQVNIPFDCLITIMKDIENRSMWDGDLIEATILQSLDLRSDLSYLVYNGFADVLLSRVQDYDIFKDHCGVFRRRFWLSEHSPRISTEKIDSKKRSFLESLLTTDNASVPNLIPVNAFGAGWVIVELSPEMSLVTHVVSIQPPYFSTGPSPAEVLSQVFLDDITVYRPQCLYNLEGYYNTCFLKKNG